MKRKQNNINLDNDNNNNNNNNNKKRKIKNFSEVIFKTNKSLFEDLANETIYEIFDYLDINHSYEAFFNLNKRFQNLFLHSNLPIQVNVSDMSKTNFEHYHKKIILPNKHRINYLRLSNPFIVDIVFSPPRIITQFIRLETLVLDHINAKYLYNILKHAILLPELHSLILSLADYMEDISRLFTSIFCLPNLKSCEITYEIKTARYPSILRLNECKQSSIEYLTINSAIQYDSLNDLFLHLPKLSHLTMKKLIDPQGSELNSCPTIVLKHLKYLSVDIGGIDFYQFEQLIKNYCHYLEVLRLSVRYDEEYLDPYQWERFIVSDLPHLRIFDFHYEYHLHDNRHIQLYELMNQFNSKFWIERGWFFTRQYQSHDSIHDGVFYSIDSYRRKDHLFYWELDEQMCPYFQKANLNSVKHIHICSTQASDRTKNYFSNATELTIKQYFNTPDDSIITTLNRIIPLQQLTNLIFECYRFSLEEIIKLIRYTPNLHTLKFDFLSTDQNYLQIVQRSNAFQYVSKMNKIKHIEFQRWFHLVHIPLILNLFTQLEYLEIKICRKEIEEIIRHLLTKKNHHLFFLCIPQTPKVCLREIDNLIKSEKLLENYFIKIINHDLYLWW